MATRYDVITGRKSKDGQKTFWTNVGSAWPRDQGGFSIELSAYPLPDHEGKVRMMLVEPKPRDEAPARPQRSAGAAPADLGDDVPFLMEWR
jgi:hypothetical protein